MLPDLWEGFEPRHRRPGGQVCRLIAVSASPVGLVTGFPGFIGERLLPRLVDLHAGVEFACLVQARFKEQAERRAKDDDFNKGREAASACLASVKTLRQVKALKSGKK